MFYEVEREGEIKEVREVKEIRVIREVKEILFTKFSKLLKFSTHPTTNLASEECRVQHYPHIRTTNLASEWCGSGALQKRIPRDSTISTAPTQPNFASEECRVQHSAKMAAMDST